MSRWTRLILDNLISDAKLQNIECGGMGMPRKAARNMLGKLAVLVGAVMLHAAPSHAALIGIRDTSPEERAAAVSTLTALGHTVTDVIDGNLDLIVSTPGNATSAVAGVPYLQVSDWGSDTIANAFQSIPQGQTIDISVTGAHPILTGLPTSWTTQGFWFYDPSVVQDYIGFANAGTGLADGETGGSQFSNVLAVDGSSDIYIGWNVFGDAATAEDVALVCNSVEFLVNGSVTGDCGVAVQQDARPVPALPLPLIALLAALLVSLGLRATATRVA